jgi:heme-degrading monooxygenase HmoA
MIERHWKGITQPSEADKYTRHLMAETFQKLKVMSGFIRASILKKEVAEGVEFLIVTVWESLENIKEFTGEDISVAVVPDKVKKMMVRFDETADHYEVEQYFES